MLTPFNILYPYQYEALKDDEFIVKMQNYLAKQEDIINLNKEIGKNGNIIQCCLIEDEDDDYFVFKDITGKAIEFKITGILNPDTDDWIPTNLHGVTLKTDPSYTYKGRVLMCELEIHPIIFNKSITGTMEQDTKILQSEYFVRLEKIYLARVGCSMALAQVEIQGFDEETNVLDTTGGNFNIMYPDALKYNIGDIVKEGDFFDPILKIDIESPYVVAKVLKQYMHISRIFNFDSNRKIVGVDTL